MNIEKVSRFHLRKVEVSALFNEKLYHVFESVRRKNDTKFYISISLTSVLVMEFTEEIVFTVYGREKQRGKVAQSHS